MRISGINSLNTHNYSVLRQNNTEPPALETKSCTNPLFMPYYQPISFTGLKTKKLNIEQESRKLLKQITEHLKIYSDNVNAPDTFTSMMKFIQRRHALLEKKRAMLEELQLLIDSETTLGENMLGILELHKKYEALKIEKKPPKIQIKPLDERIDYELIKHFRAAAENGNFNFQSVYQDYYAGLRDITTLDELSQRYPQIKIPERPENVIADKFLACFTRDFFIETARLLKEGDKDKCSHFITSNMFGLADKVGEKLKIRPDALLVRIVRILMRKVVQTIDKDAPDYEFKNIKENIRNSVPAITQNDITLLDTDFDDFVLSTIKAHYLGLQKLNDIVYEKDGVKIRPASLKEREYRFEKFAEKLKRMISDAQAIFNAQRDYENFDEQQFSERLEHFAASEISEHEHIYQNILDFAVCSFTQEDTQKLIKFLRVLDDISDGKITPEEGNSKIIWEKLIPTGTQKLKDEQKVQQEKELKIKQKEMQKLRLVQNRFNDAIKVLYSNGMSDLAQICLNYMPHKLDDKTLHLADYIMRIINESLDKKQKITDKTKLDSNIRRFDTYNLHKEADSDSEIFKQACEYACLENGEIDEIKAGQYIINSEIVEEYPDSKEVFYAPEVLSKILEKVENKSDAVKLLCRYDNYYETDLEFKSHLVNILNLFDEKDEVEKVILKHIIENDYLNIDTSGQLEFQGENGGSITVTLASKAKKEIADKYKFPRMIDFLTAFEEALSSISTAKGNTGVKLTGKNNATIKYKMELKISGNDDRVFSSNNDYYFDTYSEIGLH